MKLKLLSAVIFGLTVASAGVSAAEDSAKKVVAKVISQEAQVLAEDATSGSRRLLVQGAEIFDNDYLIVPEKASIELQYVSSQCKVVHGANSLVTVTESAQCGSGDQQLAVGQGTETVTGTVVNAAGNAPATGKFSTNGKFGGSRTKSATGKYAGATVGSAFPIAFTGLMFVVTATSDDAPSP